MKFAKTFLLGWLKWLGLGVLVVILGAVVLLILSAPFILYDHVSRVACWLYVAVFLLPIIGLAFAKDFK